MFSIYDGRNGFCQWDVNQKLVVSAPCEVHFCNGTSDCSLVCETYEQGGKVLVDVPNILLQTAKNIRVYAYVKDNEEQYTKASKVFSVRARTKPDDYVYTETEVLNYNSLDKRITDLENGGAGGGSDEAGKDGADGFSPIANVTQTEGGVTITITDKDGTTAATVTNGKDGADGCTPVKGVDYYTEEDKQELVVAVLAALPVYNGEVEAV